MSKFRFEDPDPSDSPTASEADATCSRDSGYASPPCFLHEVDPSYLGYMGHEEVFDLLNTILREERPIQRCIADATAMGLGQGRRQALDEIARKSSRICQLVAGLIQHLGRMPTPDAGLPSETLPGDASTTDALNKVHERQSLLISKLSEALPRMLDGSLRRNLERILRVYEGGTE